MRHFSFRRSATTASSQRLRPFDLRALKEEQVAAARERVFGPQGNMPGDKHFKKPLEGKDFTRWYFPSKFAMADFRTEEYFEMQAERFAPREVHQSITQLTKTLEKVSKNRKNLKEFFGKMDEATFLENPTLQDLYGLYRLLEGDNPLPFVPPREVFLEHAPFGKVNAAVKVFTHPRVGPKAFEVAPQKVDSEAASSNDLSTSSDDVRNSESEVQAARTDAEKNFLQGLSESPDGGQVSDSQETSDFVSSKPAPASEESSDSFPSSPASSSEEAVESSSTVSSAKETAEHGEQPPTAGKVAADSSSEPSKDELELVGLMLQLKEELPENTYRSLDAKITRCQSLEEIRGILLEHAENHNVVPRFRELDKDLGTPQELAKEKKDAEDLMQKWMTKGPPAITSYLARRHRFVDPMYRRRRLKWLEREIAGLNKEKEVKYNKYFVAHPDKQKEWPVNKGSVTVAWPSPYH